MFNLYKLHTFAANFKKKLNNTKYMTKKHLQKWNTLRILLLLLCVYSCTDDKEKSSDNSAESTPSEIMEVKNFLKDKILSVIDMNKTFGDPTHMLIFTKNSSASEDFEPNWQTLQNYKDEEGNDVQIFELKSESPISGLIYSRSAGKEKTHINTATSKLVVWKLEGILVGRIMTYIPDYKFSRDSLNDVTQLGYKLEDSNFSGVRLVSTLDGIFLYGDKYDEGQNIFHFLPTKVLRNTIQEKDSTQTKVYENDQPKERIYFKLLSEKKSKLPTRATYTTREGGGLKCSFCGKLVDKCSCLTITPPKVYCPRCGMETKYCLCCNRCKKHPCICCNSCLHYPCICCKVCHHRPCVCCKVCHHYPCTCSSTGSGGGGTGGGSTNPGAIKPNKKIPYAAKDFPGYDVITDCYTMANYILNRMLSDYTEGTSYYINTADKNGNITNTGNAKTVFDMINTHLDANRPIKVGVDYKSGGNQSDHLTDHWIVVNGRGYDTVKQQYYFNYIETGRNKVSSAAAVGDNRLYYDSGKGTISGPKWNNQATYVVNQIKNNIKK